MILSFNVSLGLDYFNKFHMNELMNLGILRIFFIKYGKDIQNEKSRDIITIAHSNNNAVIGKASLIFQIINYLLFTLYFTFSFIAVSTENTYIKTFVLKGMLFYTLILLIISIALVIKYNRIRNFN